jgi:hypothetical protein
LPGPHDETSRPDITSLWHRAARNGIRNFD